MQRNAALADRIGNGARHEGKSRKPHCVGRLGEAAEGQFKSYGKNRNA